MRSVALGNKRLIDYVEVIGEPEYEALRALGASVAGTRVRHVNATAYGGGVAEILQNLVPLLRDVGVDASWSVLEAPAPFYDVTKKLHNSLQGMAIDVSDEEKRLYLEVQKDNAAGVGHVDVVLAHDPQAVALRHFSPETRARWVWRCHIDTTTAYDPSWSLLRPYVEEHDAAIFTMPQFVRPDLRLSKILIQKPTIDPNSPKNRRLPDAEAREVVARFGVDPDRPLLLQVSRFDPWKDPLGVIDAYRLVKAEIPTVQLVMIGSLADDDPEGMEYLRRTQAHAGEDPDVKLLTNLEGVKDREVNAFQCVAAVVVQKSLREGFGLVVAEALWKGVPVVGGAVGGIPTQIIDGETGFLVSSVEDCARRCLQLLRDPALRQRMGEVGREHVRKHFLITRDLRDQLELARELTRGGVTTAG
ncbi:MAG: glycosyltransferase [Chloroflexi bacterium]|nr:MAG: glycosyltransferase [Chloroflexota bacterium]